MRRLAVLVVFAHLFFVATSLILAGPSITSNKTPTVYGTIHSIGIEWELNLDEDSDHDGRVAVSYRRQGSTQWKSALDLFRVDRLAQYGNLVGDRHYNMFAGSILFLRPDTTYEIQLVRTDPDGGSATRNLSYTTKPIPVKPTNGRTLYVIPGSGGGSGTSSNPYRGFNTASQNSQPGDVILLRPGDYGYVQVSRSGGPNGQYIVFQPETDGVYLQNVLGTDISHVWLDNLNFGNRETEDKNAFGVQFHSDSEDVVITNNYIGNDPRLPGSVGYLYGISLSGSTKGFYIADNTLIGENTGTFQGEGIFLSGSSDHTIAYNDISLTSDGVSEPGRNVDIFGNNMHKLSDDGAEIDYSYSNNRIWGNRINSKNSAFSFQPNFAGPTYMIRNQVSVNGLGIFKHNEIGRFIAANNTFVGWKASNNEVQKEPQILLKGILRNNLWLGADDNSSSFWEAGICTGSIYCANDVPWVPDWRTDWDYDGFDYGSQGNFLGWWYINGDISSGNETHFQTLQDFTQAVAVYPNAITLDKDTDLAQFNYPSTFNVSQFGPIPLHHNSLSSGSRAIDAGGALPNINDKMVGSRPDLGAYEYGHPLPHYGPRTGQDVVTHAQYWVYDDAPNNPPPPPPPPPSGDQPHKYPRVNPNLVQNPALNEGSPGKIDQWILNNAAVFDPTVSRTNDESGSAMLPGDASKLESTWIDVTPGKTYSFSIYMKTDGAPFLSLTLYGEIKKADGSSPNFSGTKFKNSRVDTWEELTLVYTAGPDDREFRIKTHRWPKDDHQPRPGGKIWLDDGYIGEGLSFDQPPANKTPFNGGMTRIDPLGNVSIKKGSNWESFFPLCVYTTSTREDWSEYSAQGFNCGMWTSTVNSVQKLKDAGMMAGFNVSDYVNEESNNFNNMSLLRDRLNGIINSEAYDNMLFTYMDNEHRWSENEWQAVTNMVSEIRSLDQGNHPIYMLQGGYGTSRGYDNPTYNYQDLTGTYVGGNSGGQAGPAKGIVVMDNLHNNTTPVTIAQMNHGVGQSLRPRFWAAVANGAKGMGFWMDYAPPSYTPLEQLEWWNDFPQIRQEVDALLPIIQQPHWASWTVSAEPSHTVFGVREYQGEAYLIITNDSSSQIQPSFSFSGLPYTPVEVQDAMTGATVAPMSRTSFSMTINAYDARIVKIASASGGGAENFTLTVNSGSGDGAYTSGTAVNITANTPPSGQTFDRWTGQTSGISNINAPSTILTMPAANTSVTATYKPVSSSQEVVSLTLINADTNQPISEMTNNMTLVLSDLPTTNLNIRANTSPLSVGSVRFDYNGNFNFRLENSAPYALHGDSSGNYLAWTPAVGNHTVVATPFSGSGASGTEGTPLTLAFTVSSDYSLTVNGGSGDGTYSVGTPVNIVAGAPPTGHVFDRWTGNTSGIADVNNPNTTLTMPADNVVISATYISVFYDLTVLSGSGGGSYPSNTVVPLVANPAPLGHVFSQWIGDTLTIDDIFSPNTTIVMPAENTTITANYELDLFALTVNNGSGDGSYISGTSVPLVAHAPPPGHVFNQWTGDTSGVSDINLPNAILIMPTSDVILTATFKPAVYTLSVVNGSGDGVYTSGTSVPLVANRAPSGQEFDRWTGDTSGILDVNSANTTLLMPGSDATVTATYKTLSPSFTLTVNNGAGDGTYNAGTSVNISADLPFAGFVFDQWIGDISGISDINSPHTSITMPSANATVTAIYKPVSSSFLLSVTNGSGGGMYEPGTDVTIMAGQAPANMIFDRWTGDTAGISDVSSSNTILTMPSAHTAVQATYKPAEFTLTINNGSGSGDYPNGTVVSIQAAPPLFGHVFDQWLGDTSGVADVQSANTTITMPSAGVTLTASYRSVVYNLTVNSGSGSGNYSSGSPVQISADTPPFGQIFDRWIGDVSGVTNVFAQSTFLIMPSAHTSVTATYRTTTLSFVLTVNNGFGGGNYPPQTIVHIVADTPPVGHVFVKWAGEVAGIDDIYSPSTSLFMPQANKTITAIYQPESPSYILTVNSGLGAGSYSQGTPVSIFANPAPIGYVFDQWVGDVQNLHNKYSANTTLTMPGTHLTLTATYRLLFQSIQPEAKINVDRESGTVPAGFKFDGSFSSDPDGIIMTYFWEFGDGHTSNQVSPGHTYYAPGEYIVRLTVVDNKGVEGQAEITIQVLSNTSQVNSRPVQHVGSPDQMDEVQISMELPQEGHLTVDIYDRSSQFVRRLDLGYQTSGQRHIHWDGLTEFSQPVSSGYYVLLIKVDGEVIERTKAVIIR